MNDQPSSVPEAEHRVIFVGGSSYSGSTMLDMMLAHGPDGFSCGEVGFMFKPYREHQLAARFADDGRESALWSELFNTGSDRLYREIFDRFPDVRTIVDSTKDPIWIHDQSRILERHGIATSNVIIWKTPDEFFASREKRGRRFGWRRAWINYHRLYFRLVPNWVSVRYSTLAKHPESLQRICQHLDISYFPGKEAYWNGSYQTIFGNASAKVHLHSQDSDAYQNLASDTPEEGEDAERQHQQIRYIKAGSADSMESRDPMSKAILDRLVARDATAASIETVDDIASDTIAASAVFVLTRRAYRNLRSIVARSLIGLSGRRGS